MSVKQQGSIKQNYKLKELRVDVYFEMSQLISLTSISFLSFFFWKQFVIQGTFNREHIIFLQGHGVCHSLPTVPINRIGPFSGAFDTFQGSSELSYRLEPIKAAMKGQISASIHQPAANAVNLNELMMINLHLCCQTEYSLSFFLISFPSDLP